MRALVPVIILLAISLAGTAAAQGPAHHAGLVVQYGDGGVQTVCVAFPEEAISGIDLLDRSGIPVVTQASGIGAAVCKIGPDGCDYPAEGCFCKRDGARSIYWAYQVLKGGSWSYASLGAANVRVRDGDVNGWAWGVGDSSAGAQPPVLSIDAICAAPPSPTAAGPIATAPSPAQSATPGGPGPQAQKAIAAPSPTPAPAAASQNPAGPSYLAFVAIAAILVAGTVIAARRR